MNRADTSNKLNKLSVGLFYNHHLAEDNKFYNYIYPPVPVPSGQNIPSEPDFWNLYGYSQFLVWILYYPSLFLVLTGPLAPILMTIPMFTLMGYFLLQPSLFAAFFPDRVQWTDEIF
jgi:hypothetical protein